MMQKLKKVDWTSGLLDLIVVVLFFVGLGVWLVSNGTAQAKIEEFNTVTQTWTEVTR